MRELMSHSIEMPAARAARIAGGAMIDFRDVTRPVYHAMKFGGHYRPSRPAVALIISLDGKCDAPGSSERMYHAPKAEFR